MMERVTEPQFIESNRIAPFKRRALDVSVVLDLMIHDIDLIHRLVGCPVASVEAVGRSIFTDSDDVANARLTFENGCVANVTSSRISMKTERSLRFFQQDAYVSVDLHKFTLAHYTRAGTGPVTGPEDVRIDRLSFEGCGALMAQARAFIASIQGGSPTN